MSEDKSKKTESKADDSEDASNETSEASLSKASSSSSDQSSEFNEGIAEKVEDVVEDIVDDVKDKVEDVKEKVEDLVEDVKESLDDAKHTAESAISEVFGDEHEIRLQEDGEVKGIAAYFNHPDHLMYAAEQTRDSDYEKFDAYSPFPVHGMDEAMGLERSWIPWVTFAAGSTGFATAFGLQFGIMGFDWPMVFGGRPFIAWPSFVPILFELTVLFAGVTTAFVMLAAAGCFRKPFIIDKDITNDQFVLWISADDESFDIEDVITFMRKLNPHKIRAVREGHK